MGLRLSEQVDASRRGGFKDATGDAAVVARLSFFVPPGVPTFSARLLNTAEYEVAL